MASSNATHGSIINTKDNLINFNSFKSKLIVYIYFKDLNIKYKMISVRVVMECNNWDSCPKNSVTS